MVVFVVAAVVAVVVGAAAAVVVAVAMIAGLVSFVVVCGVVAAECKSTVPKSSKDVPDGRWSLWPEV